MINPKRHDCTYPDKHLAGVGVALKLVQALCARAGKDQWLPAFVKIAAIGTLADVVPLVGENRVIARLGLASLSRGPHTVGLRALLDASGLTGKTIDSYQVGVHPRAARQRRRPHEHARHRHAAAARHRRGDGRRGARAGAAAQRREPAAPAGRGGARRRRRKKAIETDPAVGAHNVLVVGGDGWHRGVIGIAASKLVDAYHKPAIVLSIDGDVAHGSCRSIPDFDMLGALERCADLFLRFGGHRQAAGLTMEAARVAGVPRAHQRARGRGARARSAAPAAAHRRRRSPESDHATTSCAASTRWGRSAWPTRGRCSTPRGVEIVDGPRTLKERHLKMTFSQEGRRFRAIAWRAAERADFLDQNRAGVNLAFSLERNEFQGETYLELSVADFKAL